MCIFKLRTLRPLSSKKHAILCLEMLVVDSFDLEVFSVDSFNVEVFSVDSVDLEVLTVC